jgi:hypothetical protein
MSSAQIGLQTERHAPKGFFATDSPARTFVLGFLLVAAIVAVYYPVHHHPFFYPDDGYYIVDDPPAQRGLNWQNVKWAFTTTRSYWHPITWLCHAMDCQLFGLNPAGHHDVNVLFHALNALVLFWVLRRATGYFGRSMMVAALFALHPINVEPVGWIAELKTLICTLFCLLTLDAYRWYASKPGNARWVLVVVLFLCALMGKPLAIVLPFLLLLWDYWPLRRMFGTLPGSSGGLASPASYPPARFSALLAEKIPFLLLCILDVYTAAKFQGALHPPQNWVHPFSNRVGNAIVSYARYIGKAIWPFGLAPVYPHPGSSLRTWQVLAALAVLTAITALVAVNWRRRYLTVGWLWFLAVLVPNSGLMQLGDQAMADRYAYLSFLGLFLMICWSVAEWAKDRHVAGVWLPAASVVVLLALAIIAHRQVGFWQDEMTLWSHTLQVTNNNFTAEYRVGNALEAQGKTDEAMEHYDRALAIDPSNPAINFAMGFYQRKAGDFPAAVDFYNKVINSPDVDGDTKIQALANLGYLYRALGDTTKADEYLKQSALLLKARNEANANY